MVLHWFVKSCFCLACGACLGLTEGRREMGRWQQRLLDACITMIAEADGDSTPPGQRLLCVLPDVKRLSSLG